METIKRKVAPKSERKWTDEKLFTFYQQLTSIFGPHWTWSHKSYPGNKGQFERFMNEWSKIFNSAPISQLAWAIYDSSKLSLSKDGRKQDHNQRNMYRNKIAAFDAEFINKDYFPDEISMMWPRDRVIGPGIDVLNDWCLENPSEEDL